jgi:hypothetical protein
MVRLFSAHRQRLASFADDAVSPLTYVPMPEHRLKRICGAGVAVMNDEMTETLFGAEQKTSIPCAISASTNGKRAARVSVPAGL